MRVPDYKAMRWELVDYVVKIHADSEILELYTNMFGHHKIPKTKLEVNKQQCKECRYVVCVCKPVTFYTPKSKGVINEA